VAKDQTEEWATAKQDQLRLDQLESRRPQEALAFFAGAAGTWDRLRSELYGNSFNDSALLSLIPSNWTVADLGCGSGILTARIAPHVDQVIGIDQSTAMLKAAKKRTSAYKNVDLRPGSLESLPLDDASVDATLVVLALSYLKDARRALDEMSRVLKPGGRAVVVDLLRHDREQFRIEMGQTSRGFSRDELHDLLAESGLQRVSCRPLAPEADAKGPALLLATAVTSEAPAAADDHPNTPSLRPQGDPPRRARDAGPDVAARAYGKEAAEGREDHGLAAHDRADRGADRDADLNSAPTCAGCSCNIFSTQDHAAAAVVVGRPKRAAPPTRPRAFRCSRGRARRSEYWWCTVEALLWPDGRARP
jgi:SAM-dependent methyltransferase